MSKTPRIEPFVADAGDDLADEQALIAAFIEQVNATRQRYYQDLDLKSIAAGRSLLGASPEAARKFVLAAVQQVRHWDRMAERVRSQGENELARINAHHLPGWEEVWGKRIAAATVVKTLTRRKLPFERADLLLALQWCAESNQLNSRWYPIGNIVRALQRFAEETELDAEFISALQGFASQLRGVYDKDTKRYATVVEQMAASAADDEESEPNMAEWRPTPRPAPVGTEAVLTRLKQHLGVLHADLPCETSPTGPDAFALRSDSPLADEHRLLTGVLEEVTGTGDYHSPNPQKLKHGKQLSHPPDDRAASLFLAAAERQMETLLEPEGDLGNPAEWQARYAANAMIGIVRRLRIPWTRGEAFDALLYLSTRRPESRPVGDQTLGELIELVERYAEEEALTEGERFALHRFRMTLVAGPALGSVSDHVRRVTDLVGDGAAFCLAPGEAWSDAVNQDFSRWSLREQKRWVSFFSHLLTATASKPSSKWLKSASEAVALVGETRLLEHLSRWLPEVARGRTVSQFGYYAGDARGAADTMQDENALALRGLLWLMPTLGDRERLTRLISEVTLSAYKKVPGVGPRAVKVGNAGVYALSEMGTIDAVGQLAVLKVRVKFGTAQKEIEKAFTKTAASLGLPRDEIEEMGVPSYGLTEVGRLIEEFGEYEAEIEVTGADACLAWRDRHGKPLKSVPAKVSKEHADELKDLRQSLKDIKAILPAQRDRIDSMFLAQRTWPISAWRERYLEHPLVGTIAGRLIWCVDGEPVSFIEGVATDLDGSVVGHGATAEITLWHPVGRPVEEVVAWRRRLEELRITQPFKQAHREVYLLTAAEENTRTYSNRFAAHVLRQHQFNALCSARGWKNQLRLMVDDSYAPPTKRLPGWGLRAEFWVEGIGEEYETDTNESGSYLYLATDQVRFYRDGAAENWAHAGGGGYTTAAADAGEQGVNEPLPLDQIPPLVFSEVMRDVDLFVGVASVGNDPNWNDGGPDGRYQNYWTSYSFGDLSATAATRKEVLERLVPRLKIASRCSFTDRFLVVQGDLRTYKIHLGSGNILMEPNDEYLCIVPDSRSRAKEEEVYLPFEGDRTLSIILSKALMLAADKNIQDTTILRQINR
ncbi:DUF4132 domain-containing protein [Botrimarina mediterranea]|uniref:Uncharacterized protein n=1 Tax=Botrimarina mediterranea TaxID=2528022 RepID=A0A518K7R6_9BACT|nr:DUF4132 domain-containing protein [Botrimarina mediterranea]QDV73848.1 hypothetical protein Spa11_20470 [Botrimarina mediterranea]QDV78478.1 hypothetical protein K2D_20850 [Planctomycetes bacterium K2D]